MLQLQSPINSRDVDVSLELSLIIDFFPENYRYLLKNNLGKNKSKPLKDFSVNLSSFLLDFLSFNKNRILAPPLNLVDVLFFCCCTFHLLLNFWLISLLIKYSDQRYLNKEYTFRSPYYTQPMPYQWGKGHSYYCSCSYFRYYLFQKRFMSK